MTRELQVTADNPQNHIAIAANAENALPARSPSALIRTASTTGTSAPLESFAPRTAEMSLIERVNAMSSKYPTMLETATAMTIPHGSRRLGSTGYSEALADAS